MLTPNTKFQKAIFKSVILNLQQKTIKRKTETYKQFYSIYVQLSRFQSLERVLFLERILLDNINNQSHQKLETDNKQFQKLKNITLLSFTNAVA